MNDEESPRRSDADAAAAALAERRHDVIETCELIESTITSLPLDQATFRRFATAVERSPETASTHFPHSVATWYAQSVLVRLRTLGDRDKKSHSMYALLARMKARPEDWTLAAIVELWDDGGHPYPPETLLFLAKSSYKFCADASGTAVDVARLDADLQRLETALDTVKLIVDRTIAHVDRRGANDATITYDQVREAINECEKIALPYIALHTGRGYSSLTPVEQTDWWTIFDSWR
jgi:hypothetical protein